MLLAKQQRSGRPSETLIDHPANPPHFPWVWEWFLKMRPGFSWPDLEAWARMSGAAPAGWECELLIDLDRCIKYGD